MERYPRRQVPVPIDVVAEILVRLPVKSLIRFQCVSKTWRSLILDPSFMHSHRRRSQQKPFLLIVENCWMGSDTFTIFSLTNEAMLEECCNSPKETLVEYFKSPDISSWDDAVVASSPDLLLFRKDIDDRRGRCFFLLNPSTGERLILPESPNSGDRCTLGLDYVPSIGRFKVARFFPSAKANARTQCEVLVVGVDRSWRPTKDYPFAVIHRLDQYSLLNGAIHMVSSSLPGGIAVFNLHREIWRMIQFPCGFCFRENRWAAEGHMDLRELTGSLYLSRFTPMKLEIWVLKDYENENWTMQYNIDTLQLFRMIWHDIECYTRVHPLMIKDDGKILIAVSTPSAVFHYDTEKKVFTALKYIPQPCVYVENYLPLN
ncbi:putative F-box protein At1g47790 isoform X1 [Ananas comosus]|uniref:F-box protein At1g47790 isoform X1 n=2 Tax=Ananas comosus TaxID=4615 RepID=A0A6P5FC52_ANACO|nr:putative F-box protein At1g47790 isoform X1 [Ananas comosus]XP_020093520.1 putative F-box protein At1g47790 isoform X1 [Ananas comosus]